MIVKKIKDVPERIKKLDEVKDVVLIKLKKQKAERLARDTANLVLNKLKKGQLPKDYKGRVKDSDFFKLSDRYIPGLGSSGLLAKDLLLAKIDTWLSKVYKVDDKYVVVKLKEIRSPDEKLWEKQKEFWEKKWRKTEKKEILFK